MSEILAPRCVSALALIPGASLPPARYIIRATRDARARFSSLSVRFLARRKTPLLDATLGRAASNNFT